MSSDPQGIQPRFEVAEAAGPKVRRARSATGRSLGLLCRVVCLLALMPLACGEAQQAPRLPAPEFDLERVEGGRLTLQDLRGKLVLLDFWATWCVPCVKAIPELNAVYAAHRDSGVEVVGIAVDDLEADELREWITEKGVEYPVARSDTELAEAYGALQFPQHVLLSREGEILEQLAPGVHSRDELEALIDRYLD